MTKPLSREFLISRKQCCSHKCVNCPYIPKYKKESVELSKEFIKFKSEINNENSII